MQDGVPILPFSTMFKEKSEFLNMKSRDFPGGAVVKNPPASAGDMGSSPGPGGAQMPRSN